MWSIGPLTKKEQISVGDFVTTTEDCKTVYIKAGNGTYVVVTSDIVGAAGVVCENCHMKALVHEVYLNNNQQLPAPFSMIYVDDEYVSVDRRQITNIAGAKNEMHKASIKHNGKRVYLMQPMMSAIVTGPEVVGYNQVR